MYSQRQSTRHVRRLATKSERAFGSTAHHFLYDGGTTKVILFITEAIESMEQRLPRSNGHPDNKESEWK